MPKQSGSVEMTEQKKHENQNNYEINHFEEEREIDILALFYHLVEKGLLIGIASVLGALLVFAITYFAVAPKYQSVAKMYIVSSSNDSIVDISDLNIGTTLTKDYEELILSYPVLQKVINKLELEESTAELAKKVTEATAGKAEIIINNDIRFLQDDNNKITII